MTSSKKQEYFEAVLYLHVAIGQREALLERAITASGGNVAGIQMHFFQVMNPETARFSRTRKVTPAALERIQREYTSGDFDVILFSDRKICEYLPSDEPLSTLSVGDKYDEVMAVELSIPREMFDQREAVAYLRSLALEFSTDYGCGHGGSGRYVGSIISFIPTSPPGVWILEPGDPEYNLEQELGFYYRHRKSLGQKIPRACWGNILSPAHVEGLGGEERIRNESGCYLVERWGENLYLQLTESPWDVSKEQLLALNRYFEPIRFPGAPEPVYLEEP